MSPEYFLGQIFPGKEHRIYLLGNPVVFFAVILIMVHFMLLQCVHITRIFSGTDILWEGVQNLSTGQPCEFLGCACVHGPLSIVYCVHTGTDILWEGAQNL